MRALFGGRGPVHFREVPAPKLDHPSAALIKPLAVALCDLDYGYIKRLVPVAEPYAIGHEFTGEIVEVGPGVQLLHPGDRVVVPFQISCGLCNPCRGSRSLDCSSVPALSAFGLEPFWGGDNWGGAAADLIRVPYADAMCVRLPEGADLVALASVSDNAGDGYRCIAPHLVPGTEAIVLGSGSVGLYAVATACALSVPVTYLDNDPKRLSVAEQLGARVVDALADGRSYGEYPLTVAALSSGKGLISALRSTAPGGICHSAGIHFFPVNLPLLELYRRGIRFYTGRASAREQIPELLSLYTSGRLNMASIVGNVIEFADAPSELEPSLTHKTVLRVGS